MIRAVIFDLDGLLVDTETADYESWRQVYAGFGLHLPVERWLPNVGLARGPFDPLAPLRELPGFDEAAVLARRRQIDDALVARHMRPLPGVATLLASLQAEQIRRAVASTSRRDWVAFVLSGIRLASEFDVVVSGDQVPRGKPSPDVYLEAARRLEVPPGACVALEDSRPGVTAAKAAGMPCIAVPNRLTVRHDLSAADLIVGSLEEVTLDLLKTMRARLGNPSLTPSACHAKTGQAGLELGHGMGEGSQGRRRRRKGEGSPSPSE